MQEVDPETCPSCLQPKLVLCWDDSDSSYVCYSCGDSFTSQELAVAKDAKERATTAPSGTAAQHDAKARGTEPDSKPSNHHAGKKRKSTHPISTHGDEEVELLSSGVVDGFICGTSCVIPVEQPGCDHACNVFTREGDVVCDDCGAVLACGASVFHYGVGGAAFTWRKGTYRIKYYFNEKMAQWSGRCPPPTPAVFDQFVEEAKRTNENGQPVYGHPRNFRRADIARMCKAIGRSTMQEKWILLIRMLKERDPEYFSEIPLPPLPSQELIHEVTKLFYRSLPAWQRCKDIDIAAKLKELGIKASIPLHYGKKKRKSYPHNHMIRRFLYQIQLWSRAKKHKGDATDQVEEEMACCFDRCADTIKRVSQNIEIMQDVIYAEMCLSMNDGAD